MFFEILSSLLAVVHVFFSFSTVKCAECNKRPLIKRTMGNNKVTHMKCKFRAQKDTYKKNRLITQTQTNSLVGLRIRWLYSARRG